MTLQLRTETGGYSYSQAAESATMESNTTADKCWREYFMLRNGISNGVQQSAAEAAEHPGTVLAEFGGSAAIAGGLAWASRGGAAWKVALGLGVAAMTYSFAKDVAGRMGVVKSAMDDTWQSGANMRASEQKVASVAGPFVVDLAATTLGAGFGGTLGLAGPELYAAARARATSAVEVAAGRLSLAPTYDVGSAFEGVTAKSAVVERTMTSDLIGSSAAIAGAPSENFYLRGKLNAAGVWEPVRDIQEVPMACKRLLLEKLRDVSGVMMEPKVANQFVDSLMPVLHQFEPLPANAPQDVVLARAKKVLQAINTFGEANNMPRLKLSLPDASDQASLVSGKMLFDRADGYIAVKPQDMLRSPGTDGAEMTAARLYHEIGHNKQVYDIFKVEANRLGVPKSGVVNAMQQAELREQMQWRLALGRETNISDSYMQRLLQTWQKDTTPITAADQLRADELTGGFVRMADPGPQYATAAQQAAEANRLQQMVRDGGTDGANQALNELRSPAAQRKVFGYTVPDAVAKMTLKPAGTAGAAEALQLDQTLGQFISGRNQMRQSRYLKYMEPPELEAWILQQKALIRAYRFTASATAA